MRLDKIPDERKVNCQISEQIFKVEEGEKLLLSLQTVVKNGAFANARSVFKFKNISRAMTNSF